MKALTCLLLTFISFVTWGQSFNYYGPQPFDQILNNSFSTSWSPSAISAIENRKYVIILDEATQSQAIAIGSSVISVV